MAEYKPIAFPFPVKGLDQNWPHGQQPVGTTSEALNVRSYDSILQRLRGGRRPGMSKYLADQINGTKPVQNANRLKTTLLYDSTGLFYGGYDADTYKSVARVSSIAGAFSAFFDTTGLIFGLIALSDGSIVFSGQFKNSKNVWKVGADGVELWSIAIGTGSIGPIRYDAVNDRVLIVGGAGSDALTILDPVDGSTLYSYTVTDIDGDSTDVCVDSTGGYYIVGSATGNRAFKKINPTTGAVIWEWTFTGHGLCTSLSCDASDNILVTSQERVTAWGIAGASSGNADIWSVDTDGAVNWAFDHNPNPTQGTIVWQGIWLSNGDIAVGTASSSAVEGPEFHVLLASNRSTVWSFQLLSVSSGRIFGSVEEEEGGARLWVSAGSTDEYTGATSGEKKSLFAFDLVTGALEQSYLLSNNAFGELAVRSSDSKVLPPVAVNVATTAFVSAGTIRTYRDGTLSTPTGGSLALITSGRIDSQAAFGHIFYVDGENAKDYLLAADPVDDAVTDWTLTAGSLPAAPRLISLYGGRVVLSGTADDPHNWFMSRLGDPLDFDYFPATVDATIPVAGNNSEAGLIGDVVNTLVPISDDVMFMGCDSSIWAMSGNPAAGGVIDQVSNSIGMAFGNSWTIDPLGTVYFFGVDRNIYRMTKDGMIENISANRIKVLLESIDLTTHHVRLAWDTLQQGLYVVAIKNDLSETSIILFWEYRTDAWWQDDISEGFDMSSMFMYDADDPDDRTLLIGCTDGYIRSPDLTADSDDGVDIEAFVRFAPINAGNNLVSTKLNHIEAVMGDDSADITLQVLAGETPEKVIKATAPKFEKNITAGRNPDIRRRVNANSIALRLYGNGAGRWACDTFTGFITRTGRTRRRL